MLKSERILFQDDQSKRGWQTSTHSLLVPHAVLATAMERRGILFKVLSGGPCHFSDLSVWISSSSYLCGSSHTERSQGCLKLKHLTILRWRKRSRDMIFPSSSWFSFSKLSPMSSKWKFHLQILLTIHPWGISCVTVSASKMETWTLNSETIPSIMMENDLRFPMCRHFFLLIVFHSATYQIILLRKKS